MAGYLKAIVAAVVAGAGSIQQALDGGLTNAEILAAVVSAIAAFGAVYATTNRPAR